MSKLLTVAVAPKLSEDEINGVLQLMADAEAVDHMKALNEAAVLRLRRRHPTTQHLLVSEGEDLLGYAQLESGTEWSAGQLMVSPDHRRRGIGSLLLQRLIMESSSPLRVWAMGDTPAARALAATAGMVPRRKLLIMERQLDDEVPEPVMPPGVQIRTFVPGQDKQEWLRVNAAAFADHPEQALIDSDDLADRMALHEVREHQHGGQLRLRRGYFIVGFEAPAQPPAAHDHLDGGWHYSHRGEVSEIVAVGVHVPGYVGP